MEVRGADAVARQALTGLAAALRAFELQPALVNGAAGMIMSQHGRPLTVMGFTVADGRIAEIDAVADPKRLQRIAAACWEDQPSAGMGGAQPGRGMRQNG
jgi:hypothetical protein